MVYPCWVMVTSQSHSTRRSVLKGGYFAGPSGIDFNEFSNLAGSLGRQRSLSVWDYKLPVFLSITAEPIINKAASIVSTIGNFPYVFMQK